MYPAALSPVRSRPTKQPCGRGRGSYLRTGVPAFPAESVATSQDLAAADRQLWQAAANGDEAAKQRLVERAWTACAFRLRRFRGDDRDEIKQSIAASVLRALASGVVPQRNLDGLLEWRGRAEITSFVRKMIRERRIEGVGDALEHAGHAPSPFDLVAGEELRRMLNDCLERIPSRDQREALSRRLGQGAATADIAGLRAVKPELVRVWLARASALVRACLEAKLGHSRGS